jgi:glutamate racemase
MSNSSGPIGVFDSGFGGLTVFREIVEKLPEYDYIYLGDNARTPYGHRSFDTVHRFTLECIQYLFRQNCPLIITACNTASAKALVNIQKLYLPEACPQNRVLGVIRPTVEAIGKYTKTREVALWATPGTVRSDSFYLETKKKAPGVELYQQACPMLVPLVESGELEGPGLEYFIKKYWDETQKKSSNIDTLLLGCTHYPLIKEQIQKLIPEGITVLSQDTIVAPSLVDYLERHPEMVERLSKTGQMQFQTTDNNSDFDRLGGLFMQTPIRSKRIEI